MKLQLLLAGALLAGLSAARAQAPVTLFNWNQTWKFFHPMGTMPTPAGNFATTWYLPDAQYDSPLPFGASPEVVGAVATLTSYDSGSGPGPLGYGTIDYVANNAATAQFAAIAEPSLLTTPASGSRRTAYYKTTFTVPPGGVGAPKLEFLCDDGGYLYLDGTPIASMNITAAEGYAATATNATNTETDTYVLDLSTGGTRNLTGTLLNTRTLPVTVTTPIAFLAEGTHTLAMSVHNSAADSSDSAFAAKLTALTGVCAFSTSATAVTRNYNGTAGNPNDDTISADITVTPGSGNAPSWNVTASSPGAAGNVTTGAFGSTHTFTFPVSTLVGGAVTLTFVDAATTTCTGTVTLTAPPPPYLMGKKRFNGVESDLFSAGPMPTAWRNTTPAIFTNNGTGSDRATQELRSETLDLTGLPRPVIVVATFRANENSAGSNFEVNDNFSAEIIEDGGAPVSLIGSGPGQPDFGNGAASHPTATDPEQPNGAPNGWLQGFSGTATADPNPVRTATEDYDFYKDRDEFNSAGTSFAGSTDQTYEISYTVPDAVNSIVLSFRGGNDSTSEFFTLSGIRVRNGACDMQAAASNIIRDTGADVGDPADDLIRFNLLVTGNGATWTFGTFSGAYGTAAPVSVPVSESGIAQVVVDAFDANCTSNFTVTAPQATLVVTDTVSQGTTFSAATAAGNAQSYTRPVGGTELGWTGGDADVIAGSQPAPNTTARYLDMNGKTAAGDFLTEAVILAPSVPYVRVRVDLGAYTTSGTAFEDDDAIVIAAEASSDPTFPVASTTQYFIYGTAFPPAATGGLEFYNAFKVKSPEAINFGTAAVGYPTEDFPLTRRGVIFSRGANTYVRLRISGGPSAAGSEHAIVDNITIERGFCTIVANNLVITHDNKGDDDRTNDEFSATATIDAIANGASTGWTSTSAPNNGQYGLQATFGPYPVSGGPVSVTLVDDTDLACSLPLTFAPPACSITLVAADIDPTVTRNTNATPATVNDDIVSFTATITGANGGTGWKSNIPVPGAPGTFYTGMYGVPANFTVAYPSIPAPIVFTDSADTACTANYTVPVPHEQTYALGKVIPLAGAESFISSLNVPAPAAGIPGWSNPADGVLTQDNGGGTNVHTITAATIDATALSELLFSAELVITETSAGSNFEAADTFKCTVVYTRGGNAESVILTQAYDTDANGVMNGYDDIAAAPYNTTPEKDEFNRPLPGVPLADSINHTFALSAVIPADADQVFFSVEGLNNSASEHFRVQGIRLTEQLPNPNADTDGDGVGNAAEAVMGTDPGDPSSVTRLAQNAADPSQFSFQGVAGRFYRVYVSDDSAVPTHLTKWNDAGLGSMSGAGAHTLTITPQAGVGRRFYRLHVRESDVDWPAVVPAP